LEAERLIFAKFFHTKFSSAAHFARWQPSKLEGGEIMNAKKILAVAAAAALAIGIGATGKIASAQQKQQDPQWANSIGTVVSDAVLAQVQQEVANAAAQIASVQAKVIAAKVDGKILATLAAAQERIEEAQQAATPQARVFLNGEDFSAADETGWLGVTPEDISADRAKELKLSTARGIYVSEVEKDSPAEKAGLKSGDVILEFNGAHVEGVTQFRRLVRETPPGHSVSIVVSRDGKSQTLNATLSTVTNQFQNQFRDLNNRVHDFTMNMPPMQAWEGPAVPQIAPMPPRAAMPAMPAMPTAPPGAYAFTMPDGAYAFGYGDGVGSGNGVGSRLIMGTTPSIGISGENLSGQLGTYFGAPDGEGVLVREVQSGSPAEKGGLKAGDVITKVAGDRVKTLGELQSKLREKHDDKTVQITVVRRGSETSITVEPNKPRTIAPARAHGVA
jgi:C-terminal processing protease CtpA/Prc